MDGGLEAGMDRLLERYKGGTLCPLQFLHCQMEVVTMPPLHCCYRDPAQQGTVRAGDTEPGKNTQETQQMGRRVMPFVAQAL